MNLRKYFILLLLCSQLYSCSYIYGNKAIIQNYQDNYLQAKITANLKMPIHTNLAKINTLYPIDIITPITKQTNSLIPPNLNIDIAKLKSKK